MDPDKDVILVTGSSGLIGAAVIRRFAPQFTVIGFDRAGDPHPPKEAECVCVDVTSDASVEAGLARVHYAYGGRIASVIHLAAYYDFSGEPSPKYTEVTVRGTERLLRRLQAFQVEQFVFSSTMLVHAPTVPGQPITEDWPVDPRWDYPKSKVETEALLRSERAGFPSPCSVSPGCTMMPAIRFRWRIKSSASMNADSRATSSPEPLGTARRSSTSMTWWTPSSCWSNGTRRCRLSPRSCSARPRR